MAHVVQRSIKRMQRLWIMEALLVAAILVFGGFALMSDARVTPAQLTSGLTQIISH